MSLTLLRVRAASIMAPWKTNAERCFHFSPFLIKEKSSGFLPVSENRHMEYRAFVKGKWHTWTSEKWGFPVISLFFLPSLYFDENQINNHSSYKNLLQAPSSQGVLKKFKSWQKQISLLKDFFYSTRIEAILQNHHLFREIFFQK